MYFKKNENLKISSYINIYGVAIIKSLVNNKSDTDYLKKNIRMYLNNPDSLTKSFNIRKAVDSNVNIKGVTIHRKKYFLNKTDLIKGYKHYSKLTNSIEIKDPLLKFNQLNKYIINKYIIAICKKYFKTKSPKILYVALRCFFKNSLPETDVNLFHTDDRNFKSDKRDLVLKLAIPLNLNRGERNKSSHLIIRKDKLGVNKKKFYKFQHCKTIDLPRNQKKYIINPNVKNKDAYLVDPNNFFHKAQKSRKLRCMLYAVYGKKTFFVAKKSKKIKIYKSFYKSINKDSKKFASLLKKVG